jgi:hypothetical protein
VSVKDMEHVEIVHDGNFVAHVENEDYGVYGPEGEDFVECEPVTSHIITKMMC